MRYHKIIYSAVFLVLSFGLFSCSKGDGEETQKEQKNEKKLPVVKVKNVELSGFSENLKVVGVIKPMAEAKVSSEEGGLIVTLNKDKGSPVRKGEIIARIKKDVEYATYEQVEAQVNLARMNYEKQKLLWEENATTELQYLTAEWQYKSAERQLEILKQHLKTGYVRSPLSGVVSEKYVNRGEMSAPGAPMLHIIDISRVKVSAGIPEKYISQIKKGQDVKITVDVIPGAEFSGKVNFIAPALSTVNRTFEVEVIINNSDRILKPEMSANVEITQSVINDAVVLPQDYVVDFGESNKYVFVLDGDIARKRMIVIGGRRGNDVMITSGLNAGEKLIYEGFQQLADNDKVQVIN